MSLTADAPPLELLRGRLVTQIGPDVLLYSFQSLGPRPVPWRRGHLIFGSANYPARMTRSGPVLDFLVENPIPEDQLNSGCLWQASPPREKNPAPSNLPGLRQFLDPSIGWLLAITESLPGKGSWPKDLWKPLPASLPPGISFVWTREKLSQILGNIVKNLPDDETVTVVCERDSALMELPGEKPALLLGLAQNLPDISLPVILENRSRQREQKLDKIRDELTALKKQKKKLEAELAIWHRLEVLERDMENLRLEVEGHQKDWARKEDELSRASHQWGRPVGLKGFLGLGPNEKQLQESQLLLEDAEKNMILVRQERDTFLREARQLKNAIEETRSDAQGLSPKANLTLTLSGLQNEISRLTEQATSLTRPFPRREETRNVISQYKIYLVRPDWQEDDLLENPDNLIVVAPEVPDHRARLELAHTATLAKKRFIILADYTPWALTIPAPEYTPDQPAWHNYLADQPSTPPADWLGNVLGPLPYLDHDHLTPGTSPSPGKIPALGRLEIGYPAGLALRLPGEPGPFNPVSALATIKLAAKIHSIYENQNFYIICPSPSQAFLVRSMALDLEPSLPVWTGEARDFEGWPPATVILDTAMERPQTEHPWTLPVPGRQDLLRAVGLAKDSLIIVGRNELLGELSSETPLGSLWQSCSEHTGLNWQAPLHPEPFWEALDKAVDEVLVVMPPFAPVWWENLAPHFHVAIRRKVQVTILASLPKTGDRDYPGTVIRDLKLFGASVILSQGFFDFMAVVDREHFSWGYLDGNGRKADWSGLKSLRLPKSGPLITQAFQLPLINQKLGPGSFRNCPLCGWPYLLINQGRTRDFGDRQPLKLGCLNPACNNHKRPRRLDERWPFTAPPVCQHDQITPYHRRLVGRNEMWICPRHPDCQPIKVIPGDIGAPLE